MLRFQGICIWVRPSRQNATFIAGFFPKSMQKSFWQWYKEESKDPRHSIFFFNYSDAKQRYVAKFDKWGALTLTINRVGAFSVKDVDDYEASLRGAAQFNLVPINASDSAVQRQIDENIANARAWKYGLPKEKLLGQ